MVRIEARSTLLRFLKDPYDVLNAYRKENRPFYYEQLVVQSFARILNLPLEDRDDVDANTPHKVTWFGSKREADKAPGNHPDGLAHAHDFKIGIEATLAGGSKQWAREFAQAVRHADRVIAEFKIDPQDLYFSLVVRELSDDTFSAIRSSKATRRTKLIPFELRILSDVMETSLLARTMRHVEIRRLLHDLVDDIQASARVEIFRKRAALTAIRWQKHVLDLEKPTMLAIKSYEAILRTQREHAGLSEIILRLQKDRYVKSYLSKIEQGIEPESVERSLIQESLGVVVGRLPTGEHLFAPVPIPDFRSRCTRRLTLIESIGASVR
jgi:hypothetical protein